MHKTLLPDTAVPVAVNHIADTEFLVLISELFSLGSESTAVCCRRTVGVINEVCAVVEVGNLICMLAIVVTDVDTGSDREMVVNLVLVVGDTAKPFVVVDRV